MTVPFLTRQYGRRFDVVRSHKADLHLVMAIICWLLGCVFTIMIALDPEFALIKRGIGIWFIGISMIALGIFPFGIFMLSDSFRVITDRDSYVFAATNKGKWLIELPSVRSYTLEVSVLRVQCDSSVIEIQSDAEMLLVIRNYLIAYDCNHGGAKPTLSTDISTLNRRTFARKN